ncbi:MAG: UDP-N-acetylmuramoyl-L-alanine--D-glutamate ligase [Bacillota bacterium]
MINLIKGKEILVVGMARSGMAAVELLSKTGAAKITVTDQKQPGELKEELARLEGYPTVKPVTGGNPAELVTPDLSMIIKSPGVPPSLQIFKKAEEFHIPVLSEIELAYAFIKAPLIGVTGTNGKTTVTALITAMLKEARMEPVVSAGNIGNPLAGIIDKISAQGAVVAELSSFQLENILYFRPAVAVFLNFAEDHIDYHGSIDKYFHAKARIFENQGEGDFAVLNAGDRAVASLKEKCRGRVLWFDRAVVSAGVGLEDGWVKIFNPKWAPVKICPRTEIVLPGEHNLENVLAAAAAAWAAGADPESIGNVLRRFRAIEHRLEHVTVLGGVDYINDSKGTNPGATIKALQSFPGRHKILIAGGKDKGSDFTGLAGVIRDHVRLLLLFGETKEQIARAAEKAGFTAYRIVADLGDAVQNAYREAREGDIVLLSPACASWDMFSDYEARGNQFKELVKALSDLEKGKGGRHGG